jgi:predicted DNA-binding transcriptional regulator AlpA
MTDKTKRAQSKSRKETLPRLVDMGLCATGLSRRHLYTLIHDGEFPKPVQLAKRRIAFREADIITWLDSRREVSWAAA